MPKYTVKLVDGTSQSFSSDANLTDEDAYQRAIQEQGISSGHIPTTFRQGFLKAAGEDPSVTGPLLAAGGMATGTAPLVAAAPALAQLIKAAVQKGTGDPVTVSPTDVGIAGAEGVAAGYGPQAILSTADSLAASTLPHQINGKWVKGLTGSGIMPWAAREGAQGAKFVADKFVSPLTPNTAGDAIKALIQRVLHSGTPTP